MANHPIPIIVLPKGRTPKVIEICVPWGDTITIPFDIQADLIYIQTPPFPPAFWPHIPMGHFYPGDVIGFRTAQHVTATVTIVYTDTVTGVSNTIKIHVQQKC